MRTLKLIARFYNGIFWPNFLVTFILIYAIILHPEYMSKLIGTFFWCKVLTTGAVFFSAMTYKKKELYYYQNLGVSKVQLGVVTSVFDFLLWVSLTIIAYKLKL